MPPRLTRRQLVSVCLGLPLLALSLPSLGAAQPQAADPLPSWNDGAARRAILEFVAAVTREGSPDFVPPEDRIAAFDNDGTLWPEQLMYTQLAFAMDRVKKLAPLHPDWQNRMPMAT